MGLRQAHVCSGMLQALAAAAQQQQQAVESRPQSGSPMELPHARAVHDPVSLSPDMHPGQAASHTLPASVLPHRTHTDLSAAAACSKLAKLVPLQMSPACSPVRFLLDTCVSILSCLMPCLQFARVSAPTQSCKGLLTSTCELRWEQTSLMGSRASTGQMAPSTLASGRTAWRRAGASLSGQQVRLLRYPASMSS